MNFLTDEILKEKYIKHLAWLDGYARSFADYQMNLAGYQINGMDFNSIKFREADLRSVQMHSSSFTCCNFDYAQITSGMIENCSFTECSMMKTALWCMDIISTAFNYTNLGCADFRYSTFQDTSMIGASLREADFSYCIFDDQTDIRFADITGAVFTGTRFDFSKNIDMLPEFCYMKNDDGKTVLLARYDPNIYPMPEEYAYLDPKALNAALCITDRQYELMYQGLVTGWSSIDEGLTMYKAEITIKNPAGTPVLGFETKEFESRTELDNHIDEVCKYQAKKNKSNVFAVSIQKKQGTDSEYVCCEKINDYFINQSHKVDKKKSR